MNIPARFLISVLLLSSSLNVNADAVIRSSVAPEFVNGLHKKFLQYLADKAEMDLDINPMPFARRIQAMRRGELDIMVGLQKQVTPTNEIIYMQPSYEKLSHTFFILRKNQALLTQFDDLRDMAIGVTRWATYFDALERESDLIMVSLNSLRHKIKLLQNGRIDTFIHYQQATLPVLQKMGLMERIIQADYQPGELSDYYFTISANSPLFKQKSRFEAIIRAGVKAGDFARVRRDHYKNRH